MARIAVIHGTSVANVIEAEPGFDLPGALLIASDQAGPGWSYDPVSGAFAPPPLPPLDKPTMAASVDALCATKMASGFSYDFGGSDGVKVLQTRDEDRPNWLALATVAQAMIGQGQGSASCGAIRTADNVNVPITAVQAITAMLAMQAALAARLAHAWALKDQIAAAADSAALAAIDINAGWPA